LYKLISLITQIGADLEDSEDLRLEKTLLVISSLMMATLAIVWGFVYLLCEKNWPVQFLYPMLPYHISVLPHLPGSIITSFSAPASCSFLCSYPFAHVGIRRVC
jgi:hypothetical protein